jgi:plasmid stabilization system protein ParE
MSPQAAAGLPAGGRRARYVLAPQAASDLVEIWRYIEQHSSLATADHVESVIREKFVFRSLLTGGWTPPEQPHRTQCEVFSGVLLPDYLQAAN